MWWNALPVGVALPCVRLDIDDPDGTLAVLPVCLLAERFCLLSVLHIRQFQAASDRNTGLITHQFY